MGSILRRDQTGNRFVPQQNKSKYEIIADTGYDLDFDSDLIRLSIVSQFGFDPYEIDEIPYPSYLWYVGALNGETPLATAVYNRKLSTKEAQDQKLSAKAMQDRVRWQVYLKSVKNNQKYKDPFLNE